VLGKARAHKGRSRTARSSQYDSSWRDRLSYDNAHDPSRSRGDGDSRLPRPAAAGLEIIGPYTRTEEGDLNRIQRYGAVLPQRIRLTCERHDGSAGRGDQCRELFARCVRQLPEILVYLDDDAQRAIVQELTRA
jgi:hypothetical protein